MFNQGMLTWYHPSRVVPEPDGFLAMVGILDGKTGVLRNHVEIHYKMPPNSLGLCWGPLRLTKAYPGQIIHSTKGRRLGATMTTLFTVLATYGGAFDGFCPSVLLIPASNPYSKSDTPSGQHSHWQQQFQWPVHHLHRPSLQP